MSQLAIIAIAPAEHLPTLGQRHGVTVWPTRCHQLSDHKAWLTPRRFKKIDLKVHVIWSTGKEWKIFLEDSHFVWFPTESIYIIVWEEYNSVVLNSCVIWNWNVINCCRWSAPKPLQLLLLLYVNTVPHMHICVSILGTSVFLCRFDDNKEG